MKNTSKQQIKDFPVSPSRMIPVLDFINHLRNSDKYIEHIFLKGSCYKFHLLLKKLWPEAVPFIHENKDHVVSKIGEFLYDIKGRIPVKYEILYDELQDEELEMVQNWSFYRNNLLKLTDCPVCDEPLTDMHIEGINKIKYCQCNFAMVNRNQKTQKAYCFGCGKEIKEF
ncbi:hypothetical protein [Christiangramia sp.]|uniref:hypothetical protein n=1 Tax=Christiangramia sp. TaxID=1931228 RepID=UPI00260643C5|nr:hypothetical protein [Christiangramia sp.]